MQAIDNALLRALVRIGQDRPELLPLVRGVSELGGSAWLVPLTSALAALVFLRGHPRHAAALLLVTSGGRLLVELLKWWTGRVRPDLVDYQVTVHSLSFPSGHAANSLIVYLTLALIVAPLFGAARWPVIAALIAAVLIGVTRPILGVHWPSDVLAGWALALAWTLAATWALAKWMRDDPRTAPPPISG